MGPEPVGSEPEVTIEGGATSSPARCVEWKGRAELLLAHGFFRRSGEAGSDNRLRRGPSARRGPATDPDYPPSILGLLSTGVRDHATGPCLLPHCDASRARPSPGADLSNDIAEVGATVKNKGGTLRLPSPVTPAQAGIHTHDTPRKSEQRRASCRSVSGYGSRALLRSPGMTGGADLAVLLPLLRPPASFPAGA